MDKKRIVAEVRRYASERDEQFDRVRADAEKAIAKQINFDALMRSPEKYLKLLYAKVGSEVIKRAIPEAVKIGKAHGEKMVRTIDSAEAT